MRWFRLAIFVMVLLAGVYALSMYYFVDESKVFKVEKEIAFPVEKVFPQFSNLQNFTRWNRYFSESKKTSVQYYEPYEGQGAALSFSDAEKHRQGELFLRYVNPEKTIKYQLFEGKNPNPYLINLKFTPLSGSRTRITWYFHTPKQPLMSRAANLFSEADFSDNLDGSMQKLADIMSNKVDRDKQLAAIKYDSLMVEDEAGGLLLGVNVSTSNKGDALIKNVILNHNKVYNFVTTDLGKQEDEFGLPVMLTEAENYRAKDVSYFYGVPLSKRQSVSDNNFSFRTLNPSKTYTIYYEGKFSGRTSAIQKLLTKAKKDTMRAGELQQTFLETPVDGLPVRMKIALPVFR